MTAPHPRVGLTTYLQPAAWGVWHRPAALVPATYLQSVVAAGGTPLLLPPVGTDPSVLDVLDALIVIGGSDLDPAAYGQDPHPTTTAQPARDEHETALTVAALDRGTPLLAICRGAQVLNVAVGGTLHQHVPDLLPESRHQPEPGVFGRVQVQTEPASRIAAALGERATMPCYHHQAIDRLGEDLVVTASSADGLVQAVEPRGAAWVLGVQFHPEEDDRDIRLFEALLAATGPTQGHHP
ncbi:MAG: gamma-glutamyl-gamma-aminobutyrate hydrolase family protein [Actinomycetota bacterium]|nr:gamma-glutamyl-gamma-aminobutyrate hydrolase family protein [Actinomycetota bacterium]MDQ3526781.1 gamma-glutamyl-gamma-aminobutyrate hydrolase family protein [Actinomycetota bacterium]